MKSVLPHENSLFHGCNKNLCKTPHKQNLAVYLYCKFVTIVTILRLNVTFLIIKKVNLQNYINNWILYIIRANNVPFSKAKNQTKT